MNTAAKGVTVTMGDRVVRFLPLNWLLLEELQDDLELVASMGAERVQKFFTPKERTAILNVVHRSLARCNEGITEQWVKENIDLSNLAQLLEAVFTTNGFVTPDNGEAQEAQPGEALAAGSAS